MPEKGIPMPPRKSMALSVAFNRYLCVYGGISHTNKYLNTCYAFDTSKSFWCELPLIPLTKSADAPIAMSRMTSIFCPEDNTSELRKFSALPSKSIRHQGLYLFGGVGKEGYV